MNRPARPAGRDIALRAADGTAIAACLYEPAAPTGRAVVIHPATGAPQTYYARFAGFLAEQGPVSSCASSARFLRWPRILLEYQP